jgi:hypothetical protein
MMGPSNMAAIGFTYAQQMLYPVLFQISGKYTYWTYEFQQIPTTYVSSTWFNAETLTEKKQAQLWMHVVKNELSYSPAHRWDLTMRYDIIHNFRATVNDSIM